MKTIPCRTVLVAGFILLMLNISCKKFLDEKQDSRFTTPQSLGDMQLLLDNYPVMNTRYPMPQEVAADNYYLTTADYNALSDETYRNYYTWQKDDTRQNDWAGAYGILLYANTILQETPALIKSPGEQVQAQKIAAAAHFIRANILLITAQIFAPPFDNANAGTLPGIPLRLTPGLEEPTTRATLRQTYDQVITDFKTAAQGLDTVAPYPSRPTRAAAFAGLARTFLIMGDYTQAGRYADSALRLRNTLINFNTISSSASNPFPPFNAEVIFPCITSSATSLAQSRAKVDTVLFSMYHPDDLRRTRFFKTNTNGSMAFKGDYNGSTNGSSFIGYTTDELYLVKAECHARNNELPAAAQALNDLLVTRWRTGSYVPVLPATQPQLLAKILEERRKELCFRGLRWSDLRRLNTDPATQVTITRLVNGQVYTLAPGSPRYTFLIPQRVIELTGIMQNP